MCYLNGEIVILQYIINNFLGKYRTKTFTVETSRALIQTLRGMKSLTHHLLEEGGQEYVLLGKND